MRRKLHIFRRLVSTTVLLLMLNVAWALDLNISSLAINKDGFGVLMDVNGTETFFGSDAVKQQSGLDLNTLFSSMMPSDFDMQEFLSSIFDDSGEASKDLLGLAVHISEELAQDYEVTSGDFMMIFAANNNYYKMFGYPIDVKTQGIANNALTSANELKIYLTGEIDTVFAGTSATQGFIHIEGTDNEQVELYLHNFRVKHQKTKVIVNNLPNFLAGTYPNGSVISICPKGVGNGEPFTAKIHIKGNNLLTGGAERVFDSSGTLGWLIEIVKGLFNASSAPLSITPLAETAEFFDATKGRLVLDDIWDDDKHTNGKLDLPIEGKYGTPSIDLGNRNGECIFNGGQYVLHCPATEKDNMFYVSSMAICYRMAKVKLGQNNLTFYGVGSSMSYGVMNDNTTQGNTDVIINDGTFSVHSADEYKNKEGQVDVVARGWYDDYTDLRLPYNTKINGGTFIGTDVYCCDNGNEPGYQPQNSDGKLLCKKHIGVSVDNIDPTTRLMKGTIDGYQDYGCNSIMPDEGNEIHIYVPSDDCEQDVDKYYMRNWVSVIPKMGIDQGIASLYFGGDQHIQFEGKNSIPIKNGYLFYTNLGEYTKENGIPDFPFLRGTSFEGKISIGDAIEQAGNIEFADISSEGDIDYTFEYGLYTMRTYNTNTWYMLSMPYDVANIYVIETLPYEQGDKDHKTYLKEQGAADANLAMTIVTSLCPDILSGNGSGVKKSLIEVIKSDLKYDNGSPVNLRHIFHYNPQYGNDNHSRQNASFYLYEIDSINNGGKTEYDVYYPDGMVTWNMGNEPNSKIYSRNWKYATDRTAAANEANKTREAPLTDDYLDQYGNKPDMSDGIVMQRGVTYAMYLPDGAKRYWDGKYLIFEGYGPQTITGKGSYYPLRPMAINDEEYGAHVYDKEAVGLQANVTFRNDTINIIDDYGETYYTIFRRSKDQNQPFFFERVNGDEIDYSKDPSGDPILPGEVYAVLSKEATEMKDEDGNYIFTSIGATQSKVSMPQKKDVTTDYQPVADISKGAALAAWSDNGLNLHSFEDQMVEVYSSSGQCVMSRMMHDDEGWHGSLPSGVYIIKADNNVTRIVVQ